MGDAKKNLELAIGMFLVGCLVVYAYTTHWPHYVSTEETSKAGIEYLNEVYRAKVGVPPLKWSKRLFEVAMDRIEEMHAQKTFKHADLRKYGLSPYSGECLYRNTDYSKINEKDAINMWYNSTLHRVTMLDPLMTTPLWHASTTCAFWFW